MKRVRRVEAAVILLGVTLTLNLSLESQSAFTQSSTPPSNTNSRPAKPVTIPLTIRVKGVRPEPELRMIDLTVTEDGEPQTILSIRSMGTSYPITLALLIQDDVVPSIGNEIKPLSDFVRKLPRGSRVLVGYLRTGTLQVRQKFTNDLEKAAKALRPPVALASLAPYNPYVEIVEALKRFDSQPLGRRAVLLISDGLDISHGIDSSSATQSLDLQRAINDAQRRSVAIYAFYAPTAATVDSNLLSGNGQSSLQKLADDTGGRAFFQGMGAPVSFDPFIKELDSSLDRQVALTYLSTHPGKGFHRVGVRSSTPGVAVDQPSGYTR